VSYLILLELFPDGTTIQSTTAQRRKEKEKKRKEKERRKKLHSYAYSIGVGLPAATFTHQETRKLGNYET
jgi:hypothetical protein